MNANEVVFELVLLPNAVNLDELVKDKNDKEVQLNFESISNARMMAELERNAILTKVRVRTAEQLLWVVRAADIRLWGLIGKSRYYFYDRNNDKYIPLFRKEDVPNGTRSWRINRVLVMHFTAEVPNESRSKRGYRQRLKKPLKEVCEENYKLYLPPPVPGPQINVEDSWFIRKNCPRALPLSKEHHPLPRKSTWIINAND